MDEDQSWQFGQFVKIKLDDSVTPLALTEDGLSEQTDVRPVGVHGKVGRLLGLDEEADVVLGIVETFDGWIVKVPQTELEVFMPEPGEKGGFDVMWPFSGTEDTDAWEAFGTQICDTIAWKGFCVVQLSLTPEERSSLREPLAAMPSEAWRRICVDVEAAYVGRNASDKVSWLPPDLGEHDPLDALTRCDRTLSELAHLVSSFAESHFGFSAFGRTGTMARIPASDADRTVLAGAAKSLSTPELLNRDGSISERLEGYVSFVQLRRLCMLQFAAGSGGELRLHPKPDATWLEEVRIPCEENRLVLFRHDLMSYTYAPTGESVALQTWMLSQPHVSAVTGISDEQGTKELRVPCPKYGKSGRSVGVMSMHAHLPGDVNDYFNLLPHFAGGCDDALQVPMERWNHDWYFSADGDLGSINTKHGGFVVEGSIFEFDNDFFGYSAKDSQMMCPGHRRGLEVGYMALARAGFTRKTLLGKPIMVSIGHCGTDFTLQCDQYALEQGHDQARSNTPLWAISGRLSMVLGLRGPSGVHDTACSSSLVALSVGHWNVRPTEPGAVANTNDPRLQWVLAQGCNDLMGPLSWIALCAPHMCSATGRCYTFDQSADGFNRGEGTVGVTFRALQANEEALDSFCMVSGTSVNQDGRSASMTAPHGPSQQDVIRNSLREANIQAADVRMAELHGTGTALGDPIELGALRGVMRFRSPGVLRDEPIFKTSAKSNTGHTEATAGITGFAKCCLMLTNGCCMPNTHLRALNPNTDTNQYPVYFASELVDVCNSGNVGVSSFGFGGTNARGDVWGRALAGPLNTGGSVDYDKLQYLDALRLDSTDRARAFEDSDFSQELRDNQSVLLSRRAEYAKAEVTTIDKDWRLSENDALGKSIPKEPASLPIGPGTGKTQSERLLEDSIEEAKPEAIEEAKPEAFTLERAIAMQDELMAGYSDPEWLKALHEAVAQAGDSKAALAKAMSEMRLKVQAPVIPKYGYEASSKGVRESVLAFVPYNDNPDVAYRNAAMTWYTSAALQAQPLDVFLKSTGFG